MRGLKIAGWAILGLLVLFVLGAIAVVAFVDPNDYKDDIAKAVRDRTGRELKLDGKLSLSVFPWLAIETGHAELGNPTNFGAGPFVAVDSADVGVKLIPLLHGHFEVRRLLLEGLRVNLVKDEHGHTNWEDLTKTSPASSGESSGSSASIAGLTLKNAALDYRDLGAGSHWRLMGLNLSTGRLGGSEPFDLDLSTTVDQGEGSAPMQVKLKSEATLDTKAKHYGAKDFSLDVVQAPAKSGDKERKLKLDVPALTADLNQQTLEAPKFILHVAGAELSGSLKGEQIVDKPRLNGTIKLPATSPRDLLQELGQEAPGTRDAKVLSSMSLDADYKATDESVSFENLKLTLDDTHVTGRAGIENLKDHAIRFDLTVDQLDLARVAPHADVEAAGRRGGGHGLRAADRARGAVERAQEAVSRRLELLPAVALQLEAHGGVVLDEHLAPGGVADARQRGRRADDVGEEQRHQYAIGVRHRPSPGQELLHLLEHPVRVDPGHVVISRELDETRAGNVLRDVAALGRA